MNSAVRVLVPELNVRDRPWVGANVRGVVTPRDILAISGDSPFENDGYTWYHGVVVSAIGRLPELPTRLGGAGEPTSGWFAATKGSTAYVARLEARCPDTVDLEHVGAMLAAERLACFGDRTIELDGRFFCAGCSNKLPGRYQPFWLASHAVDMIWQIGVDSGLGLALRFKPTANRPVGETNVRVRGHFRDAAAERCSIATFYPWYSMYDEPAVHDLAARVARQLCRQEFVVESYEEIGTDPNS
jgi:hypothetical protein